MLAASPPLSPRDQESQYWKIALLISFFHAPSPRPLPRPPPPPRRAFSRPPYSTPLRNHAWRISQGAANA
eukprot:8315979-Pyramimonas_sp.AAC.1